MPRKKAAEATPVKKPRTAKKSAGPVTEAAAPKAKRQTKTKAVSSQAQEKIVLQFSCSEWDVGEIREKAIAVFVADGHYRGNIRNLSLYMKPEEGVAYYVINDKYSGKVDL